MQRAAQSDRQMLKIAAHPGAFREHLRSRLRGTRELIPEGHSRVYPVADGLDARPSPGPSSKQFHRDGREPVDFTVAAAIQIAQRLVRQLLNRHFSRTE